MVPRKGGIYGKKMPTNNARPASFTPTGFSQAELLELQESFKLFDIDNTGSIQVGDLSGILKTLQEEQQHNSNAQVYFPHLEPLLQRLEANYNEEDMLSLDDFIDLMSSTTISNAMAHTTPEDETTYDESHNFKHVFRLFDVEGKGYVTIQDLERVAVELGEHDMTREELQDMIHRAKAIGGSKSSSRDQQRVGLDEFTRVMTMNLFP